MLHGIMVGIFVKTYYLQCLNFVVSYHNIYFMKQEEATREPFVGIGSLYFYASTCICW